MQDPPLPPYLYQWTANDFQNFVRYGNLGTWSRHIGNVNNQTLLHKGPLERQQDLLNLSVLGEIFGEDASAVFIYLPRFLSRTPVLPHLLNVFFFLTMCIAMQQDDSSRTLAQNRVALYGAINHEYPSQMANDSLAQAVERSNNLTYTRIQNRNDQNPLRLLVEQGIVTRENIKVFFHLTFQMCSCFKHDVICFVA